MKIRKFFAGSSREALRLVREALGPDAVVLSNRAIDGGVELVALAENDLASLASPTSASTGYAPSPYDTDSTDEIGMPRGGAGLPDPFASTFGAPAASVEQGTYGAPSGARVPPRPTWDEQHTSGAAASYQGRVPNTSGRHSTEPNHAVDQVVERAVERSLRQQSEQRAAWRAESASASHDTRQDERHDERHDARYEGRHETREQAQAQPAQFAPHTPDPRDRIVKSAPPAITPAAAMARKMGAPAAPHAEQPRHTPSAAPAARESAASAPERAVPFAVPPSVATAPSQANPAVNDKSNQSMSLPDSAAAFAVPPVRAAAAPQVTTPSTPVPPAAPAPASVIPQPSYSMRTTVTASLGNRLPIPNLPLSVAPATVPAVNTTPIPPAAAPAPSITPQPVDADAADPVAKPAASLTEASPDLADQIAAEPVNEAQARVAEMVAQSVIGEIHSMRGVLEEQLAGLLWSDRQRREPARGQAAKTLLAAGFSAQLVKLLIERMPTQLDHAQAMEWLKAALERNLPVLQNEDALLERGGVYALMGPTGVGKTTTTAKLAARCVMRYGANRVALLTTDSYRIGAHEQLRIYGKILGVGVHAVKDAADLRLALSELRNKHMVLIDTIGMSQRDRTVSEQVAMLCGTGTPVQRLLLLNATSHGDTLNEVVHAYRNRQAAEGHSDLAGCILTKLDEATNIGAVLDTVIRYRLPVHYVSTGQKVPENLYVARKDFLMESAFCVPRENSPFVPADDELAAIMAAVPARPSADLSEVRLG